MDGKNIKGEELVILKSSMVNCALSLFISRLISNLKKMIIQFRRSYNLANRIIASMRHKTKIPCNDYLLNRLTRTDTINFFYHS